MHVIKCLLRLRADPDASISRTNKGTSPVSSIYIYIYRERERERERK